MGNGITREEFDRELNLFGQIKYLAAANKLLAWYFSFSFIVLASVSFGVLWSVFDLKQDFSEFHSELSDVKIQVSIMGKDITILKDDVAILKDDVAILKDDVAGLKTDVAGLNNGLARLNERMDVHDATH